MYDVILSTYTFFIQHTTVKTAIADNKISRTELKTTEESQTDNLEVFSCSHDNITWYVSFHLKYSNFSTLISTNFLDNLSVNNHSAVDKRSLIRLKSPAMALMWAIGSLFSEKNVNVSRFEQRVRQRIR